MRTPRPALGERANDGRKKHWRWVLEALCAILARHTTTAQTCYFAISDGCGAARPGDNFTSMITARRTPDGVLPDVVPAAPDARQLDLTGPTFVVPGHTNYYLFVGHIGDAARIGQWDHQFFIPEPPHFFWPADHAWCVATGLDSTIVGGPGELVKELCASETIEVLPIEPDAPSEDRLNS